MLKNEKYTQTSKFHPGNPLEFNLIFWYDYVRSLPHEKISQKWFSLWLNYVSGKVCLSFFYPPPEKRYHFDCCESISVSYWIITSVQSIFDRIIKLSRVSTLVKYFGNFYSQLNIVNLFWEKLIGKLSTVCFVLKTERWKLKPHNFISVLKV